MSEENSALRRTQQRVHQAIVSALDTKELRLRGRAALRNLLDDRQNRDLVWIGQKEGPECLRHRMHLGRRIRLAHPVAQRDRRKFPNSIRRGVAPRECVAAQERGKAVVQRLPWRRATDVIGAARIAESMRKPAAQNPHERQVELAAQIDDFLLVAVDELAAQLAMLLCRKFADCSDAAAGICPCVQQCDGDPGAYKFVSRREARQARSSNGDAKTVHGRAREQWKCHL
jgi:hypothetical protein